VQFLIAQTTPNFTMRQVKCGMEMPWEITYGPDNAIWATESRGYRVSRINPQTGVSTVLLDLSNNKNFPNYPSVSPQGGLMGLALHPNLLSGKPYVYLAYVYRYDGGQEPTGYFFKTKVVRYTYNGNAQTLTNEEVMCDTIPGSSDHNGGRMTIANVGGAPYLFYGVGDMGGGQFANANRPNKAQDPTTYEGKILRFNIEPDADPNALDKWIPNDGNNTFGRAIYSIGHRNPQGLVAGLNGNLYQSEHGPYSDDELNLINGTGRNFGHPLVVGAADGNYNGAAVGAGTGVPPIVNEATNAANLGANYRNPMKSFFPVANATIRENYTNAVNNTNPVPNYFLSWNSIAPSGIDYYNSTAIPNWQNSILITSLKRRRVYRLQLDAAGTAIVSDTIPLFADFGRFRDVCISPDGTKIYVSCDSEGQTSGPTAGTTIDPPNKGCILEFTYAPIVQTCAFINCPSNQVLTPISGTTASAIWTAPTLSNCNANTTVSSNYASNTAFSVGTTTVTYTATSGGATVATCSFTITVNAVQGGVYCASKSAAPWNEWISNVSLGTLNNTSEKVRTDRYAVGYSDWTDKAATLNIGQSYPLSITASLGYIGNLQQQFCRVWIDFDGDNTFEAAELVLERTNIIPFASTVVVPATAKIGTTRMRVSLKNGSYPTACEAFPNGEVEDYSINIGAGTGGNNLPDLTMSGSVVPNIMNGQTGFIYGNLHVANRGLGTAVAPFSVNLYLSTDAVLSANDRLMSKVLVSANLSAGDSVSVPFTAFSVPNDVAAGNYFFFFKADGDNVVTESVETNNTVVNNAVISNPNLIARFSTVPIIGGTLSRGEQVTLVHSKSSFFTGALDFRRTDRFGVKAYFSKDTVLSPDDFVIIDTTDYFHYDATSAGFATFNTALVPTTFANGVYYIVYELDNANTVLETNETDNKQYIQVNWVGGTTATNYCASKAVLPWEYAISNAQLNTLNNTSDKFKDITQLGYSDYTNLNTTLNKGQTYPLSITPVLSWIGNLPNTYCRVWIDFNQNKTFEASELVLEKTNQNPFTQSILVPNTAVLGTTRMRVSVKNGVYPTACEAFDKGEVEDYSVIIGSGTGVCNAQLKCPIDTTITIASTLTSFCGTLPNSPTIDLTNCTFSTSNLSNNQNGCLPVGITQITWTMNFTSGGFSTCTYNVTVTKPIITGSDMALSIASTPSVYKQYTPINFKVTAKNNGTTAFTNVKIKFSRPALTSSGGTKTPSIGTFQDYCSNGVECSEWTIPTLAAGTTATLDVPVFVLNPTGNLSATATLLSSVPVDNIVANNVATIVVNAATAAIAQPLASRKPTQLIPIVIQKIYPSPTDSYIEVSLTSLMEQSVEFSITNAMGQTVLIQPVSIEKGVNKAFFDVSALPQGLYLIQTNEGQGRGVPTKFMKY
jgi:PQQ-dependent dehydrogenase (s-GDH family)